MATLTSASAPTSTVGANAALTAGVVLASALAATAAPLLVYTVTLAAFGLPHVFAELRYVDLRFKARLSRTLLTGLLTLLGLLVAARVAGLLGWSTAARAPVELIILAGLAAATLPRLARQGLVVAIAGLATVGLIAFGCVTAPVTTLVVLAVAHNLTPVGFLAEKLRGAARVRALAACAVVFAIVPLVMLSGWPRGLLESLGWWRPDVSLLSAGGLDAHLGAFVPGPWLDARWATDLFVAAVYLQVMHYAVVIHVLPRLLDEDDPESLVTWPLPAPFAKLLAFVGVCTLIGFAVSFADARRAYGVFAAVHAWIEVPLLLIALTALGGARRMAPR